jgi:TrkA domain protein
VRISPHHRQHFSLSLSKLDRAEVVQQQDIPADVIIMRSPVRLKTSTPGLHTSKNCFPDSFLQGRQESIMSTISEVFLPGVGRKFQVETMSGDRLVIVIHDDGTRELYHFTRHNLDRPASVLRLSDGEARQIAGIVGGLTYVPRSLPMAEVILGDLVLEWFTIERGAACIGRSIRELEVRTRTGASIVSIIEPDQTTRTNPEAHTVLNEGATLIAAGDRRTINALKRLLVEGSRE